MIKTVFLSWKITTKADVSYEITVEPTCYVVRTVWVRGRPPATVWVRGGPPTTVPIHGRLASAVISREASFASAF